MTDSSQPQLPRGTLPGRVLGRIVITAAKMFGARGQINDLAQEQIESR